MACKISSVYSFSLLWQTLHTKVKKMYTKDNHSWKMYKINFLPRFQSHLLGWDTIHIAYPCRSSQWGSTKVAWSSFLYIRCIVCLDTRTGTSSSIHLLILHDMNLAINKRIQLEFKVYKGTHKLNRKVSSFYYRVKKFNISLMAQNPKIWGLIPRIAFKAVLSFFSQNAVLHDKLKADRMNALNFTLN